MNIYLIQRNDYISWCEDYSMVVVASDKLHAEKIARCNSDNFAKSNNIKITEIDLNEEHVVLIANSGA